MTINTKTDYVSESALENGERKRREGERERQRKRERENENIIWLCHKGLWNHWLRKPYFEYTILNLQLAL